MQGRVVVSRTQRRLRPEPHQPREGEVRPRDRRRLPDGRRAGHRREAVSGHELRDHRLRAGGDEVEAQERPRPALQGAGGGLPRRLPRGPRHQAGGRLAAGDRLGRRAEDPAGRPVHRGLPGRRQEGQSRDHDAERLLAGLRRPGEVQGARARPDRARGACHLPGRRPVRPRRSVRRQGEERPRDRRRRRPVVPRRPRPHERSEEGRRRGLSDGAGRAGRVVLGRRRTPSSTLPRAGSGSARSPPTSRPTSSRRSTASRIRSPRARSRTSPRPSGSGTR